jgi:hypothetical protein
MKTYLLAVLIGLACCGAASSAQEHKTYRCKVVDVVTLAEDGRLRADDNPRTVMRSFYDGAIIDTQTGAVTYQDGTRNVWQVIQKGDDANDYVLAPEDAWLDDNRLAAATDFIRVRAWKENPTVRFLVFGPSTLASGPCEVVR